jgi:hypothetical protein
VSPAAVDHRLEPGCVVTEDDHQGVSSPSSIFPS